MGKGEYQPRGGRWRATDRTGDTGYRHGRYDADGKGTACGRFDPDRYRAAHKRRCLHACTGISRQKKLLISPLATSGDIFRAFGKKGYFWRTSQGDVAQVKTILSILNGRGLTGWRCLPRTRPTALPSMTGPGSLQPNTASTLFPSGNSMKARAISTVCCRGPCNKPGLYHRCLRTVGCGNDQTGNRPVGKNGKTFPCRCRGQPGPDTVTRCCSRRHRRHIPDSRPDDRVLRCLRGKIRARPHGLCGTGV